MTAPALSRNVNKNTEGDSVVKSNIIEACVMENELHFGKENTSLERNRNDCESISSQESIDSKRARRGSLLKDIIDKSNAICISLDLEHGGDKCGVTQLSAVLFKLGGLEESSFSKDVVIREVFNEYVRPPPSAIWNPICIEKTGLHPDNSNILKADPIDLVWKRFVNYLKKYINGEKRGILIAWNGSSCDLEWLYRYTQAPGSTLSFPPRVKYYMDPYREISRTPGCKIHASKSKLQSYNLSSVYNFVIGKELSGAHCSLVDAKAQASVVISGMFRSIWRKKTLSRMYQIFSH